MTTKKRGLGSPKMSQKLKYEIQSKGGKASHQGTSMENMDDYSEEYFSELHRPSTKSKSPEEKTGVVGIEGEVMGTDLTEENWDEDEII